MACLARLVVGSIRGADAVQRSCPLLEFFAPWR